MGYALRLEYTDSTLDECGSPMTNKATAVRAAKAYAKEASEIVAAVCVWNLKTDICVAVFPRKATTFA